MYGGGAQALLADIGTVNRRLHERFPQLPLILFGHSMGSLAVRAFAHSMMTVWTCSLSAALKPQSGKAVGRASCPWGKEAFQRGIEAVFWRRCLLEAMPCAFEKTRAPRGSVQMRRWRRLTGDPGCAALPYG